jgi:antirestriction protein ArdC
VPQDSCEKGVGMSFGKVSQPVVTAASNKPWVSGLSPDGRVIASASKVPTVHDSPLIAWEPAVGATTYEIQLSRKSYPWQTTWSTTTAATSVVLPLGKAAVGTWYYRVRGINPALPEGAQKMSWSNAVRLKVTGDSFVVIK